MNFTVEEHILPNSEGGSINVRYTSGQWGLPLIVKIHGLASGTETKHNEEMAFAIRNLGYPMLDIDATNSNSNLSGGTLDQFTMARHVADLTEVLDWIKSENPEWLEDSVALAGHSMGGYAVLNVAAQAEQDIDFVFCFSPVISGEKLQKAWEVLEPEKVELWRNGVPYEEPRAFPGSDEGTMPWHLWEEWEKHDLESGSTRDRLTMPIAFIVGSDDGLTTANDVEQFARSLPNPHASNQIFVIDGADHCFKDADGQVLAEALSERLGAFIHEAQLEKKPERAYDAE